MGTAIGAAIDWIVTNYTPTLAAIDPAANLMDGWGPATDARTQVAIGRTGFDDDTSQDGSQQVLVVGAYRVDEAFDIPCWIEASVPGPSAKPSRDAAIAAFDALAAVIAGDRSLGGVLHGGFYATIGAVKVFAHVPGDGQTNLSQQGSCELSFTIHCQNRYKP